MIVASIVWGTMAFGFGLLADARWRSILWSSLERLFYLLAVGAAALAIVAIVWRSFPGDTTWLRHFRRKLGPASLVAAACWIAATMVDMRLGVLALGACLGFLIQLDQRLPPGSDGVHI